MIMPVATTRSIFLRLTPPSANRDQHSQTHTSANIEKPAIFVGCIRCEISQIFSNNQLTAPLFFINRDNSSDNFSVAYIVEC